MSVVADVGDREALAAALRSVVERLGPVSVLVTAVDVGDGDVFGSLDDATWRRLLHAVLGGTGNACAAVLPDMLEAGRGTIVTLSSRAAVDGGAGETYRAAATGTILAFTRSLAVEVAPKGVRVDCVAGGSPANVAETVAFLVRDGGFYVGQVFMPAGEGA
jgi:NADP-dependent 3-hydroxy acid dehydrogenase YdfG